MLTWLRRLFAEKPSLVELRNRQDELEERIEYLAGELKRLRGRVTGAERQNKLPGATETDDPDTTHHLGTAAAKRKLRGF